MSTSHGEGCRGFRALSKGATLPVPGGVHCSGVFPEINLQLLFPSRRSGGGGGNESSTSIYLVCLVTTPSRGYAGPHAVSRARREDVGSPEGGGAPAGAPAQGRDPNCPENQPGLQEPGTQALGSDHTSLQQVLRRWPDTCRGGLESRSP